MLGLSWLSVMIYVNSQTSHGFDGTRFRLLLFPCGRGTHNFSSPSCHTRVGDIERDDWVVFVQNLFVMCHNPNLGW